MTASERAAMVAATDRHWWYRGRTRVLAAVLDAIALPPGARLLDAGCGAGRTLDDLARRGVATGVDVSPDAVHAARSRGHDAVLAGLAALPFADASFDLVTCLDVVEHVADDRGALRELWRVTRPGGALVVTVPAHPALWSAHDRANEHFRRYTRAALVSAGRDAGWIVVRESYFHAAALAPAAAIRLARGERAPRRSDLELTPRSVDALLAAPSRLEAAVLRRGGRIPAGLSLVAVLVRPAAVALPSPRRALTAWPAAARA